MTVLYTSCSALWTTTNPVGSARIWRSKGRGWPVAAFYIENDVSASGRRPRPEYQRMLGDIRAGAIDAVIVWHLEDGSADVQPLSGGAILRVPVSSLAPPRPE